MASGLSCRRRCLYSFAPLLLAGTLAGQKKPVTLESLSVSGMRTRSLPTIVWAPDGKRFAYIEEKRIWQYDVPSGKRRELITLSTFETKAVAPPQAEHMDWRNRRVAE